ncbi:PE family protein [Mycobacterium sp.]|uniref:PE family protein n=1 Tax=Mycobacterium sp. TaxID=1785 RepID=UPI002BD5F9E5|nr:PE family protein [Mycobacterium sp.]HTQ23032.1 PE family protein [Mycobacterium sp.]
MEFVIAAPAYVQAAATDLANIGSAISSANAAVMTPTTAILAAGADSVSAELAALFGLHGQMYQALSAQAAMFHNQFVELMNAGGVQYALAEAGNASPLQVAEEAINAPVSLVAGRPLLGEGTGGATPGASGQYGNGVLGGGGANVVGGGRGCSGGLLVGNAARAISNAGGNAIPLAAASAGGFGGAGGPGGRGGPLFSVGGPLCGDVGDGAAGAVGGLSGSGAASSALAGLGGLGAYHGNGGLVADNGGDSGVARGVDAGGKDAVSAPRGGPAGGFGGDGGKGGLHRGGSGANARLYGKGDHGGDGFYPVDGGGTRGLLSGTPGSPAATT